MRFLGRFISGLIIWMIYFTYPFSISAQTGHKNLGSGTSEDPYSVPKTESGIMVDAVLNEQVWEQALLMDLLYEVLPGENVTPPVRTEVMLAYNTKNLFAAFRCYDPDPSAIRANFRDRDTTGGDDWIGLILDTFNDERRSFDFLVTAQGVQYDQIEALSGQDPGWDAIWDCASRITEWGYVVEIVIPFSSIRFQRQDGSQIWGLDAVRSYPRDHRYHIGLFPRDRSNNLYLSQAIKIKGFEGVSPGRNIEINPTLIGFRNDEREDFPEGDLQNRDQTTEFGLTGTWGITPNIAMNLTYNPDFSQVEADARQLDINQPFALFYRERRPFFTEGADYFSALKRIIHTRTVRDPSWGVKLSGREGFNTLGAFLIRDEITNLIFPGNQGSSAASLSSPNTSSVIRYKRDFSSRYSAGVILTNREGDQYFNRVYGFDLDFRLTPTNQIQLLVLESSTCYPDAVAEEYGQSVSSFSDRLISFEYDHNTRTWGWWADYEEAGANFRADLGYFPRVGYRNAEGGLNYTWNAPANSWWARIGIGNEIHYFEDLKGNLLNQGASLWLSFTGAMQSGVFAEGSLSREAYNGRTFDLSDFSIEGSFWPSSNLVTGMFLCFCNQIDYANTRLGITQNISPFLTYNLGKHLRFSFMHTYERMNVQDARLYNANISQLTFIYQLNVRMFFRSIFQYVDYDYNPSNYTFEIDSEYKHFFAQLLFSYKINPRTVLFLGYSDNYYGDQNIKLTQSNRAIFMKLGYAWVI